MSKIPLSVPVIHGNENRYLSECISSGWVSSAGPWVDRFENDFSRAIGVPHSVSMTSGTAALHVALRIAGVQTGEEVLVPTLTFIATVNSIKYVSAEPVFFDCDDYLNIDVAKLERFLAEECELRDGKTYNRRTGKRVAAILPVHIFGHPVRIDVILTLAEKHGFEVIEDATESLGSAYVASDGTARFTGTFGQSACFSFNGNKIITTGGGGMLVSRSAEVAKKAKYLSTQAKDDEVFFVHNEIGYNYRLTSLQAALGIAQLEALSRILARKRAIHERYVSNFGESSIAKLISEPKGTRSNYWMNTLLLEDGRKVDLRKLIDALTEKGIQTRPIWKLNHEQKPYLSNQAYLIDRAPNLCARALSIPSTSNLTDAEVDRVSETLLATLREITL